MRLFSFLSLLQFFYFFLLFIYFSVLWFSFHAFGFALLVNLTTTSLQLPTRRKLTSKANGGVNKDMLRQLILILI